MDRAPVFEAGNMGSIPIVRSKNLALVSFGYGSILCRRDYSVVQTTVFVCDHVVPYKYMMGQPGRFRSGFKELWRFFLTISI